MIIDATFWVAVSFFIFLGVLIYFKIPQKIMSILNDNIKIIKDDIEDAEKLKDDSKNILSEHEKKISNVKVLVEQMLSSAAEDAEKKILKSNEDFHVQAENRKKSTEERIKQMKNEAIKDIKNASVRISIQAVEVLLKNSLDKSKLNKIFISSVEETKSTLKKN